MSFPADVSDPAPDYVEVQAPTKKEKQIIFLNFIPLLKNP